MKKRRLKPVAKLTLIGGFLLICLISITFLTNNAKSSKVLKNTSDFTYVNDYIFDNYYPVVNQEEKISKPYTDEKVTVYKKFYEQDATEEEQQNSIVYHDGIYMQNSGVDYKSEEDFDVVSSISGTVSNISEDTLLGKTVEIRNSSELITTYQSLGDISVKKGDTVTQGQIIGKSGTCDLNSDIKHGLHFEMYKNGQVINPEKYYDKLIKDLSDN